MITRYFTFGQVHVHEYQGVVLDKDCVVKITADDPRQTMFDLFGPKWSFEYPDPPDMRHFPRGIITLDTPTTAQKQP